MTNTEGTLALRKTEEIHTGVELADMTLEAQGIRAITDLIYYHWQDLNTSAEEQQELYYALYGLKTLTEAHAENAEKLYDLYE